MFCTPFLHPSLELHITHAHTGHPLSVLHLSHALRLSLSHTQLSDPLFHLDKHVGRVVRRPAAAAVPHARDDAGADLSPLSLLLVGVITLSH